MFLIPLILKYPDVALKLPGKYEHWSGALCLVRLGRASTFLKHLNPGRQACQVVALGVFSAAAAIQSKFSRTLSRKQFTEQRRPHHTRQNRTRSPTKLPPRSLSERIASSIPPTLTYNGVPGGRRCQENIPGAPWRRRDGRLDAEDGQGPSRRAKMERVSAKGPLVLQRPQDLPRPRPAKLAPPGRRCRHRPRVRHVPAQAPCGKAHHQAGGGADRGAAGDPDARRAVGRQGDQEGGQGRAQAGPEED
ncbi:hypothetical protein B0T25DRAFT_272931 [Lasiosphaeria hispida]|uniref:Uncharacterized protein n=1 Tax=Lasiosphaeria hispida TaxID=260671 RepID=A0AAJ0MAW1_9PEZI|nr:hypothetical protein B0T25DRAFT_272931 [Lasiosphaeria hispida]